MFPTTHGPEFRPNPTFKSRCLRPSSLASCYDPTNNKIVIAYSDQDDSHYVHCRVGSVDGSNKTITWGDVEQITTSGSSMRIRITETGVDGWCIVMWDEGTESKAYCASIQTNSSNNNIETEFLVNFLSNA